jgi:hypothetical protein
MGTVSRYKSRTAVLTRGLNAIVAFLLTLAAASGPMLGAALHGADDRHGVSHRGGPAEVHAAQCDHEDSAHHDTETCLVCRLLSQVRASVLARGSGVPPASRADTPLSASLDLVPATAAISCSTPRAPPSLL